MSEFNSKLTDGLKKIMLAGVGAAATVAEKTEEVVGELVKKGEQTVEQGKVINEELRRKAEQRCAEAANVTAEELIHALDQLTQEERAAIRERLDALEQQDA